VERVGHDDLIGGLSRQFGNVIGITFDHFAVARSGRGEP
jgi:hypothetical protein